MIIVNGIKIPLDYDEEIIKKALSKKLKCEIIDYMVIKKSVDARKDVCFVMNFHVNVKSEEKYLNQGYKKAEKYEEMKIPLYSKTKRPIIIGAGPAGLFSGLILAYSGAKPIIIERGKAIAERDVDVNELIKNHKLNPNSNVAFGLGGAGTFSDGKLTTNINNEFNRFVLMELVKYGAPEEILYLSKPHIGTDILKNVVTNIANEIIKRGGEIRYSHQFINFCGKERIEKISIKNDIIEEIECDDLILAIGHSARDTFKLLQEKQVCLEPKPFSMGVRIEHKQSLINQIQYKTIHPKLPPAEYKMAVHLKERDVYTFCMCPGGIVVPSMNEEKMIVTNGMSYHSRDLENANAAVLVNVVPSDFGSDDPLAGIYFQEKYEKLAYSLTTDYKAPVSKLCDFLNNRVSTKIGEVKPSFMLGYQFADLHKCLPKFVADSLKEGIKRFDDMMHGYLCDDAILTGVETRSSSPVRIKRNDDMQASISGIYPCGEGSGYSGGIMTSAIDGIKVALAILEKGEKK